MKNLLFPLFVLCLSVASTATAQVAFPLTFDLAAGLSPEAQTAAVSVWKPFSPAKRVSQKWTFSYGLRSSFFRKSDTDYVTAPSRLTSDAFGPHVIFLPTIEENLDTLFISSSTVFTLNAAVSVQRSFSTNLSAGFNIDVIGFSAGSAGSATFNPENQATRATPSSLKPTRWNLLILSDSDFGSLNSEFFLSWKVPSRFTVRGGMNFNFTEFKTAEELQPDNTRFRAKTALPFVSIQFPLHR